MSSTATIEPLEQLGLGIAKHRKFNDNPLMPKNPAKMYIVAPSGTGKTTLIFNIIMKSFLNYDKLWLYSKTLFDDDYQGLIEYFEGLAKRKKFDLEDVLFHTDTLKNFPIIPQADEEYDENKEHLLIDSSIKHLIIIDDFSKDKFLKSPEFGTFLDTCRHANVQIILVQHSWTGGGPAFASNRDKFTQYCLFNGTLRGDPKIDYASENTGLGDGISKESFRHIYKYATRNPHGFLYIDTKSSDILLRFRDGFFNTFPPGLLEEV